MKYIILLLLSISFMFASKPYKVYPYTIESEDNKKESLVNIFTTKYDYDGNITVSIVMLGHGFSYPPIVKIGKKKGKYKENKTMFIDKKSVGKIFYYEFENIKEGKLTIKYNNLFNSRAYIK